MKKYFLAISCIFLIGTSFSQNLETTIQSILKDKKAQVGVSILHLESGESFNHDGHRFFAMQSTFKFPIGLAVLDKMQKDNIGLDHKMVLTKADLLENTWSPIRDKYPNGKEDITIAELIGVMVSLSDNNACDYLLKWLGGPEVVQQYVKNLGLEDIEIVVNEEVMQSDWNIQFLNYAAPNSFNQLLQKSFTQSNLKPEFHDFIWRIMRETSTGANRIKGLLPKETTVYHKTGTSGTTNYGLIGAMNDAGIIALPNNKHLAITVFINNSMENEKTNDLITAQISKAAYDYFLNK